MNRIDKLTVAGYGDERDEKHDGKGLFHDKPSGKLISFAGVCTVCNTVIFYYLENLHMNFKPNRLLAINPENMSTPENKPHWCKTCEKHLTPSGGGLKKAVVQYGA